MTTTLEYATDPYAQRTLNDVTRMIDRAVKGDRNNTLSTCAAQMGHLTGANRIERYQVEEALLTAALNAGEERGKAKSTIKSGLDFGEEDPLWPRKAEMLAEYIYQDKDGNPLFKVVKTPDKKFTQRAWKNGTWENFDLKGVDRPLYCLPQVNEGLKNGETIWVVEGEKDVGTLRAKGLVATCNPHGAGKWRTSHSEALTGASVVIVPDHDIPGLEHAIAVKESLEKHGCSVVVVLPAEGQDATDQIESGKQLLDLPEVSAEEMELHIAALRTRQLGGIISLAELLLLDLPEQSWVVDELVAPGVTLLFSVPKGRKSFFCFDLAISVCTGRPLFEKYNVKQGSVLYLALEDSKLRLKVRADKILGDDKPGPLYLYTVDEGPWGDLDEGGAERILDWCKAAVDPRLVIIDVFEKVRGTRKGSDVYSTDYEAVRPLSEVAVEAGVAIVLVHHTSKREYSAEDPMASASGSNGLRGSVDNLIFLRKKGDHGSLVLEGRDLTPAEIPLDWDQPNLRWRLSNRSPEDIEFDPVVELLEVHIQMPEFKLAAELRLSLPETKALLTRMRTRDLVRYDDAGKYYYLPA